MDEESFADAVSRAGERKDACGDWKSEQRLKTRDDRKHH